MKIAVVTSTYPPYHGGMGNVAATQARVFSELGHEVAVYTPGTRNGREAISAKLDIVHIRPLLKIGNGAILPGLVFLPRGTEIVFLHYPAFGLLTPILLWRLLFGRRAKLVVYYHMDPIASGLRGLIFKIITLTCGRMILRFADAILVSSFDYAWQGALGQMPDAIKKKITELPLVVDADFFAPGPCPRDLRERFALGEKNLLFVGGMDRAHYFKGVPILIQSLARLAMPDLKAHFVGGGDLIDDFKVMAKAAHIESSLAFHGPIADDELAELLRCCDLLILPSTGRSEAFGLVVLQALSAGVPVIVSNLPGVRGMVEGLETGWLVKPGEIDDLAEKIKEAYSKPERLKLMGANGRRLVLERWSLPRLRQASARFLADI